MLKSVFILLAISSLYLSSAYGSEQSIASSINVVELREVTYSSPPDIAPNPTMQFKEIDDKDPFISGGIYNSPYHHFELKIPKVAGSTKIRVIQSLISSRPDGSAITSDVIFLPEDSYGASALIVTRIKENIPKDSAYILAQFTPPNEAELALAEKKGASYKQFESPQGTVLQRSIRNSRVSKFFPYKIFVEPSNDLNTLGVSRFIVKDGYLMEFIVVADKRYISDSSKLQSFAESELDNLMSAVIKYPMLPMH